MTGGQVTGSAIARGQVSRLAVAPALASVWLVHGLYNKLLGGSPRHLAIVQSVPGLGGAPGRYALIAVGLAEVGIGLWMLSRRAPRTCAAVQTIMLLSMNVLELTFARDLLLWPAGLLPINLCFLALVWISATISGTSLAPSGNLTPLRRHPLAVRATLRECVTLTYAVPADVLRPMLPPGLELDTVGGEGFVAVALVQTERLRPDGVPAALGGNFFLAGYRIFSTFTEVAHPSGGRGRMLRGLRILRSDTDRTLMALGGNLLTHYNYHRCRARVTTDLDTAHFTIESRDGFGDVDLLVRFDDERLPQGSPFDSVREARRFAGPLPFTFDYEDATHSIIAVEGRRTNWRPAPVGVHVKRLTFFDQPAFAGCVPRLAAAFRVRDVEYHWLRGVRHAL